MRFRNFLYLFLLMQMTFISGAVKKRVLLKTKRYPKWDFPKIKKAPATFQGLKDIIFPSGDQFHLDFKNNKKTFFIGPDGGKGYKWKRNHYKWKRKDGSYYYQWKEDHWVLKKHGFILYANWRSCKKCVQNYKLTFPDSSQIIRKYNVKFKQNFYYYQEVMA